MSESSKYPFPQGNPDHQSYLVLMTWWEQLKHDKGERAGLRRADSITKVMLTPVYMRLLRMLRNDYPTISNHNLPLSKIAAIAGLTARVKESASDGLAKQMGTPKAGSTTPAFSELRLRRILACDDIEELYTLLRRALALLGDQANLVDLAATVWNWAPLDDNRPYDPRRRLAYDYYDAAPIKS